MSATDGEAPRARIDGEALRARIDGEALRARIDGEALRARIDWEALRARAREMAELAYAPYSDFQVGAAALVDDGRIVAGCNVENAAYGVALCAECGLVSALHASGGGRLVAFACVDKFGDKLMPCGRCRQLLWENGGPDCLVDSPAGIIPMTEVLPQAFGAEQLAEVSGPPKGAARRPHHDEEPHP